jgi:hypothetical protein
MNIKKMDKNEKIDYEAKFVLSNGQFSQGDQRDEARYLFVKNRYKKCVLCESDEIEETNHVAGGRWSGGCYGTDVFTCKKCGWTTSFQYDEDSEPPCYYETHRWLKRIEKEREEEKEKEKE